MVGGEAALEIRVLHRHGKGIREIARERGSSRNTVRRYMRNESAARVPSQTRTPCSARRPLALQAASATSPTSPAPRDFARAS